MQELTNYDVAYMQWADETNGATKEKFEQLVDEHGWNYVKYYEDRYNEAMAGNDSYDPECY